MAKTTLTSMLQELATWIPTSDEDLKRATDSKINTVNNREFKTLVAHWVHGHYDEDPSLLHRNLINLLNKTK